MNLRIILLLICSYVLASCSSAKYLQDQQQLLIQNKINIISEEKIPNKTYLEYELSTIPKQQPNKKFFFINREWLYFKSQDSTKLVQQLIRKRLAEAPVIIDTALVSASQKAMLNFLISRGYYNAKVNKKIEELADLKRARVIYNVYPKHQYLIDTIVYTSKDSTIQNILNKKSNQTYLKKGQPGSLELYNKEVTRIVNDLRNNGYANFTNSYVSDLIADSSGMNLRARLEVLLPNDSLKHKRYTIGDITVFSNYDPLDSLIMITKGTLPEHDPSSSITYVRDTVIDGITFMYTNWKNGVRLQTLLREIDLKSGQQYSLETERATNDNLNSLGIFKFISIRSQVDSILDTVIHYNIFLTRNTLFSIGPDIEARYANQFNTSSSRLNLIGIAARLSLNARNIFKGAEYLSNNISLELEFDIFNNFALNTVDIGLQQNLDIPRFIDYLGMWNIMRKKNKPSPLYNFIKNSNTRIRVSYNFLSRKNFYDYQLFNGTLGFDSQLSTKHRLVVNHIGIDYFNPKNIGQNFQTVLINNPFLERSFGDQLFTGFLFRGINYFYNERPNRYGYSFAGNINLEFSGAEVELANAIYNQFALNPGVFKIGDTDFSRYLRTEIDGRLYKIFNPNQSFAMRANIGIGIPFGGTPEVPYVKQFFIGGPNSIRAFAAREIGPGAHCSSDIHGSICGKDFGDPQTDLPFYQTGAIKLEFNAEYRFNLFSFFGNSIASALFLDIGNVWLSREDSSRPNSQFRFTPLKSTNGTIANDAFYQQFAIGTGTGIRFDFNYFILRFDVGYPLRSPHRKDDVWITVKDFNVGRNNLNYNLAIGYPF